MAPKLEEACFDVIFWADHSGVHDVYQSSWHAAVREAVQFPSLDPVILAAALASSTTELGFAFSANVIQDHPYAFARKLATIDHLTRGRVAWNIVTSFQPSAWRNLGYERVGSHTERYGCAEEYLHVTTSCSKDRGPTIAWSGTGLDDCSPTPTGFGTSATTANTTACPGSIRANPRLSGCRCSSKPVGRSDEGRTFAATHAEAVFFAPPAPSVRARAVADVRRRAVESGRSADDVIFFLHESVVIGSSEAEAKRKDAELLEYLSSETNLAFTSSTLGIDLSTVDLDQPIGNFETDSLQGTLRGLIENAPDKSLTFRQIVMNLTSKRFVGTPEQFAGHVTEWRAAGVSGINVGMATGMDDVYTFVDHVVPTLRDRGLIQREYAPGPLRHKLFGHGPRLDDRHPAARYRWPAHSASPEGSAAHGGGREGSTGVS